MPIHWHPPIITSTIITCFLRGTLTNQTTPISIPLSTIKGQIFPPALVLSLTYWSMFIALLSATSDHYVTREQTQTKEKTFKHFTVLERSKLLHWCCSWKGQVFTIHALNCQSPSTAAGSAKLKPSETSVSLHLQNTSLTTEPAITNSVAIETPLNNEAFPTAHHQNKPQLLPTFPSKDTLAIQDKEKPSTSSSNKRPTSPLIAYVQSLSPIKRSKRGCTPYFNIKLQTALATQPAVCFSRSKRSFFDEKAATKTALKIERYNTSQDGRTIFINDMTRLSSPATSEYNFQFVESYNSNTLTLQSILQNGLDMDMIDVIAKVVYKDKESQIVGSMKLKKSTCYIADETANSKLILWENNIDDVDVGEVYCFNQIRLRRDKETVVLNSTPHTVITKKLDSDLTNLVSENITPSDESMELSLKVNYIYSIQELSRFKQCLHCQKKIQQVTASAIVKCDHCGHVLRNSVCKENLMVKFLVKKSDESDADFDHFVVFHEVLAQMIGTNVNNGRWNDLWKIATTWKFHYLL